MVKIALKYLKSTKLYWTTKRETQRRRGAEAQRKNFKINLILKSSRIANLFSASLRLPVSAFFFWLSEMTLFNLFLFSLLLLSPMMLHAMAPKVRAEVNTSLPPIQGELQGTLSIYHSSRDHLSNLEARMDQAPLPLTFLFSAPLSTEERALYPDATSSDLVSVYRFLIPLPEPGLYPLPSISVKVGQQSVRSIPSNYQVKSEPIPTFLQLQAFVSPSLHLFPGQRARFVYRITYNQSMNLVVEELPLLKAKGFEKIGTERVEDMDLPRATVQEITQEVRALQPGTYPFAESHIEGKLSKETQAQKGVFKGTVPPLTVYVLPFPELNQPFFFSGALAPIKVQALLMTRDTVRIGDYCKLAIDVESSRETIETFSPPNLLCQVGFPGFFRIDPQIQMKPLDAKTRRYLYQLHPISYHISAIPSVEMAAFDPSSKSYVRARSLSIPLHIQTVGEEMRPRERSLTLPQPLPQGEWRKQLSALKKPMNAAFLLPVASPSSWHLHLRPLLLYALCGCLALALQMYLYPKWLEMRRRNAPPLSLKLLQAGKWQEALLHKLYEAKWIASPSVEPETLPEIGMIGKIRAFLVHLQAMRFAPSPPSTPLMNEQVIASETYALYGQIKTFLLCLVLGCLLSCQTDHIQQLLKRAEDHRELAIHATQREEQLQEVGAALQLYLQLERQLRDARNSPSSTLYQTIGHAYALLQEPGWALFYYHQALAETPRDRQLQQHITKLEDEVGLPHSSFSRLWFGYQELLYATAMLWILAFVCGSCAIWLGSARLKRVATLCGLVGILPLLAALYIAHAAPLYGIVIESTPLYRLPSSGPLVEERSHHTKILLAGTQVEVLGASPDPTWLMIRLQGDAPREAPSPFYIPSQSVRLIEHKL